MVMVPLLSFFISFCTLWLFSSQSLAHLPAYFHGTWAISHGYTPAMSIPGMWSQIASALTILSLLAAIVIGLVVNGKRIRSAQCLLLGVMAFWAWKEGFTRQDWGYWRHPVIFYGTTLLIASAGTVLLSKESTRRLSILAYAAYAIALGSSLRGYSLSPLSYKHVLRNYERFLTLISSKSHQEAEQRSQTMAIQKEYRLSNGVLNAVGHESVNVLPWSLMMAQGYRMDLVASPVLQTYSVYTHYLDHKNAQQIWDGRSADKIIYRYRTLDSRYPVFDEPSTFRAMLTCYRTKYPGSPYSVLSHVPCAPPKLLAVDKPGEGAFGEWVAIPRRASYVDFSVHTTIIGHIANIFYKPTPVWIFFRLADGSVKGPFRFIYPLAKDELFIRYFVNSLSDIDRLFSTDVSGLQRIAAIKITNSSHVNYFPPFTNNPHSFDYAKRFKVLFFATLHAINILGGISVRRPSAEHQR